MNEEQLYEKLLLKEIAVCFSDVDAFRIFCGFLTSKGINHKQTIQYYWDKYGKKLSVTISDSGNFKCGTIDFYQSDKGERRNVVLYDKKPYIVNILNDDIL